MEGQNLINPTAKLEKTIADIAQLHKEATFKRGIT